jgi:hypothetical protein
MHPLTPKRHAPQGGTPPPDPASRMGPGAPRSLSFPALVFPCTGQEVHRACRITGTPKPLSPAPPSTDDWSPLIRPAEPTQRRPEVAWARSSVRAQAILRAAPPPKTQAAGAARSSVRAQAILRAAPPTASLRFRRVWPREVPVAAYDHCG